MSILKNMWQHLTSTKQDKSSYRVAFLASNPSETMAHYIERLSAYLRVMSPEPIDIQIYDDIPKHSHVSSFQKENEANPFDGVIAMNCTAGVYFLRARHHLGLNTPTILLGNREFFPAALPHGVFGFFAPDLSVSYYQLLRKISPQCGKIVIVGKTRIIKTVVGISNLISLCEKENIKVACIYVDHEELSVAQQFAHVGAGATLAHLAFDVQTLADSKEIIELAHQYNMLAVTSNLYSIHFGADIAIGFPETKVFRYIAHRMMMLLHGVRTQAAVFNFPLEMHCNTERLLSRPYILDNIGSMFIDGDTSIHIHANKQALR